MTAASVLRIDGAFIGAPERLKRPLSYADAAPRAVREACAPTLPGEIPRAQDACKYWILGHLS